MKNIILSIALLIAAGTTALHAGENKFNLSEVKKNISKRISVPENLKKTNFKGYVLVSFQVDANGRIEVLATNSENADLACHVEQQLEKMLVKGKLEPGKVYNLRLDFTVI